MNKMIRRNPCHLSCDVQIVEAVDRPELAAFEDVMIFNIKDDVGLASKLSGGDYDGDDVVACWDERFLEPLMKPENALSESVGDVPEEDPKMQHNEEIDNREEAKVKIRDLKVKGAVSSPDIRSKRHHACYNDCIRNLHATRDLSEITDLVAAFQDVRGVDDPTTRQLGLLARKAVDAPKHGGNVRPCQKVYEWQKALHSNKWPNYNKKVRDKIDTSVQGKTLEEGANYYISQKAMGQLANDVDRDDDWWKYLIENSDNFEEDNTPQEEDNDDVLLLPNRFIYQKQAQSIQRK